jgi:hypothetical protein
MIVNVTIDRIALANPANAADLRTLRNSVAAAVQQHVGRAAKETQVVSPAAIRRASRAVAAEVAARCSGT